MLFTGHITRNSNGSIEITPIGGGNLGKIEMGSEVEVTLKTVRTAADIEEERGGKKRATASGTPGVRDQLDQVEDDDKKGKKR